MGLGVKRSKVQILSLRPEETRNHGGFRLSGFLCILQKIGDSMQGSARVLPTIFWKKAPIN